MDTPVTIGFRSFDSAGQASPESRLALGSTDLGPPRIGLGRDGRAVIVWAQGHLLRGQRFDRDGNIHGPLAVFADDVAERDVFLGMAAGGSFVLAWTRLDPVLGSQVRLRWFTADGDPQGPGISFPGRTLLSLSPAVGIAGDLPLLGDLDGDGKADPCVRRGAAVLCDLNRDGTIDLRIVFGMASDKVFLGDPNGDGRADPCLLRAGRLLCDTAHDGGLAELELDLRPLGAGTTLLGDVNGDGRDDPCRFNGTRFLCGVYRTSGGAPKATIEIAFGQPGDVPLLGDLDGF